METLGHLLKTKREAKGLLLRQVAAYLDIDQAILSKIERGNRNPNRENIIRLSEILEIDCNALMVEFLSDKIVYQIWQDDCAEQALEVAQGKIKLIQSQNK